jgi:hypothetical protein
VSVGRREWCVIANMCLCRRLLELLSLAGFAAPTVYLGYEAARANEAFEGDVSFETTAWELVIVARKPSE